MIEEDANDPNAVWIERAEHELEVIYNSYIANVERVAKEMRDWVLVPWLKANNYEFKTGNGTWSVYDVAEIARLKAEGISIWHGSDWELSDRLPEDIDRLLRLEVDGSWGNGELGLWMQDYCKEKTRNGGGQQ
jgi:hypothetical protein